MATVISLDDAAKARADELIRSGKYSSFDEVVKAALEDGGGWVDEKVDANMVLAEQQRWNAMVEKKAAASAADIEADRVRDADEVFDELLDRYRNWPK